MSCRALVFTACLAACLAAIVLSACESRGGGGLFDSAPAAPVQGADAGLPRAQVSVAPSASGAKPGVLVVPGCGDASMGVDYGHLAQVLDRLSTAGFRPLLVDHRGVSAGLSEAECAGSVFERELAARIAERAAAAAADPAVDAGRLFLVGFGLGASAALSAIDTAREGPLASGALVRRAALFYPVCPTGGARWGTSVRTLFLLGGADRVAPLAACDGFIERADGPAPVAVQRYTNARHGFDVASIGAGVFKPRFGGAPAAYDPAAARDAWADAFTLFAQP